MPGMGAGGMPDLSALFSDPDIAAALQNPKMMQVLSPADPKDATNLV